MQIQHDVNDRPLTVGQAAKIVGVSVDTLKRYEQRGLIKSERTPTGHRRFLRSDVEKLLRPSQATPSGTQS